MKSQSFVKRLFAFSMLLIFVINSSGYTIYRHHCKSENLDEVSLFVESFSCDHHADTVKIKTQTHSCCHKTESTSIEDQNCCNTISQYLKLESDFDFSFPISLVDCEVKVLKQFNTERIIEIKPLALKTNAKSEAPPLFGFDLIYSLHQVKVFANS